MPLSGGRRHTDVTREGSGLMPTRTIGDEILFKSIGVIAAPSVNQYRISPGDIVLIAARDGLFDFMSNEEIAEIARLTPEPEKMVEHLKQAVLEDRINTDNLTIMAVGLKDMIR